jgi:molybdopterin/thiamine biosynthesis adenylyltransferase
MISLARRLHHPIREGGDTVFSYDSAFSRNIGWVTEAEQERLRGKRVAVAGLGGTGGQHVLTLARLGIGSFHLADFDRFEVANMNRQAGALVSTIGLLKSDVIARMAVDVNPEVSLSVFDDGVHAGNIDAFLDGVDLYVDALDFFAFDTRKLVFEACARRGIPAITVAPLGMTAALLVFIPGGMTFEEYFRLDDGPADERPLRFLAGLTPAMAQRHHLVDPSRVRLHDRGGPSLGAACQLCAGLAGFEALKILLGRGNVVAAPHALQFDGYRQKLVRTWRPWGNRNPLQRLAMALVRFTLRLRSRRPLPA